MSDGQRSSAGQQTETLLAGARGLLHDGVQMLRVRLELLGVEARDHVTDMVEGLLAGLAAVLLLVVGFVFLAVLLTVLLWDSHRTLALAVFTTLFLTGGGVALAFVWTRWQRRRQWFASSLRELRADEERLQP